MRWQDLELLEEIGLTLYERKALATLMIQGMADAETLCREGEVPSSKIYQAMEKLAALGLAEIQPTRPKLYSALPGDEVVNRIVEISRHRAEQFSKQAERLQVDSRFLGGLLETRLSTRLTIASFLALRTRRHRNW